MATWTELLLAPAGALLFVTQRPLVASSSVAQLRSTPARSKFQTDDDDGAAVQTHERPLPPAPYYASWLGQRGGRNCPHLTGIEPARWPYQRCCEATGSIDGACGAVGGTYGVNRRVLSNLLGVRHGGMRLYDAAGAPVATLHLLGLAIQVSGGAPYRGHQPGRGTGSCFPCTIRARYATIWMLGDFGVGASWSLLVASRKKRKNRVDRL